MFLFFILSLSVIVYFICMEFDKPVPQAGALTGDCPDCGGTVESGWLVCPHCSAVLREACPECGRAHDRWACYCPWCRRSRLEVSA